MRNPLLRPLPGPSPVPAGDYDLGQLGYAEQEFLLEGHAESYAADRAGDGPRTARVAASAPFTTRLLVRRPLDAARFSGTVVVEWLNVSGGLDAAPDWIFTHTHLLRRGHAWVGVSAQRAGIEGGGLVEGMHLKKMFPERYAILSHPGDAWSFDIFSQAGRVLAAGASAAPFGTLRPARLLAAGHSQSAAFLVTYLNAIDQQAAVFDGFLVHGRPAAGASLDSGTGPAHSEGASDRIRDDLRVPVLVLQTETDVALLGSGRVAQADGELLRLWELAGAAHADTYLLVAGHHDDGNLPARQLAELLKPTTQTVAGIADTPINSGPQQHYVACAAIERLDSWAAGGPAAPVADRLSATADGLDFNRGYYGIAFGGIRTPWTEVPAATLSGLGQSGDTFASLFGVTDPLWPEELSRLYPFGRAECLERFASETDSAIANGFLLAEDRAEILALADAVFD